ncbi:MAG TPA: hypothetical protein VGR90_05655 [Acidimicrobiales bacterium]|nr:hypothetical protein [Acidimicrobiales bacterium]
MTDRLQDTFGPVSAPRSASEPRGTGELTDTILTPGEEAAVVDGDCVTGAGAALVVGALGETAHTGWISDQPPWSSSRT